MYQLLRTDRSMPNSGSRSTAVEYEGQRVTNDLVTLRADVDRLAKNIRAEKREKTAQGIACPNRMCKDWGEYKTKRDLLRSIEEALINE